MSAYQFEAAALDARTRKREARESRVLFAATFPLFLAAGLIKRATTLGREPQNRKSLIAEARAAANTCIPYAFMR